MPEWQTDLARHDRELAVAANAITVSVKVQARRHGSNGGDSNADHDPVGFSWAVPRGI